MFTAALFTIGKTCKQSKCPSTEEWIKKMWYIYRMEYYSAIKKNKIMPFAATWMNPEIIILNNVRQKDRYHITYMWNLIKNDTNKLIYETETDSQISKSNIWLPKGKCGGREG